MKYKNKTHVLYEICNEPNYVDWPVVKSYADSIISVIREAHMGSNMGSFYHSACPACQRSTRTQSSSLARRPGVRLRRSLAGVEVSRVDRVHGQDIHEAASNPVQMPYNATWRIVDVLRSSLLLTERQSVSLWGMPHVQLRSCTRSISMLARTPFFSRACASMPRRSQSSRRSGAPARRAGTAGHIWT